jgi:hypothetical protein
MFNPVNSPGQLLVLGANKSPSGIANNVRAMTNSALSSKLLVPACSQTLSEEESSEAPAIGGVSKEEEKSFFDNLMQLGKKFAMDCWGFITEHKALAAAIASIVAVLVVFGRRRNVNP